MHKSSPARSSMFTTATQPNDNAASKQQQQQQDNSSWKHLKGKYLHFFATEHHRDVEAWYNTVADKQQRTQLKSLVHGILGLDFATEKKARLRLVTNAPDIAGANAILQANGGKYLSEEAKLRTVEFLSIATPAEKNAFRNVFGRFVPPSTFSSSRSYDADYNPQKKFWKPDNMIGTCKTLIGKGHVPRPSFPIDAPAEVVGFASKTDHDQSYVWKMPRKKNEAPSQGAVAEEGLNASSHPVGSSTPWGSLDVGNIDGRQWRSVTNELFDHSVFMSNPTTRHFQNYNENYCRLLSTAVRLAKGKKTCDAKQSHRAASTLPDIPRAASGALPSQEQRASSCLC